MGLGQDDDGLCSIVAAFVSGLSISIHCNTILLSGSKRCRACNYKKFSVLNQEMGGLQVLTWHKTQGLLHCLLPRILPPLHQTPLALLNIFAFLGWTVFRTVFLLPIKRSYICTDWRCLVNYDRVHSVSVRRTRCCRNQFKCSTQP